MQNEKFSKSKLFFRFRLNCEVIMFSIKNKAIILSLLLALGLVVPSLAQKKDTDGSPAQRIQVMRQKIGKRASFFKQCAFGFEGR